INGTDSNGVFMGKAIEFLKSNRSAEVAMMLGFPATGIMFAFNDIYQLFSLRVIIFIVATFALSSAVYAFNAWAGYSEDVENERLSALRNKKRFFIHSMILFIILFIILYALIDTLLVILSLISFCLWMIYSFPKKGFKYRPLLGTLIHFAGQVIHFQMGFAVLIKPDINSILISFYFALLFSGGHLNHELIDYDADKKMGINTGAVYFGKRNWEIVSSVLFSISTLYILVISTLKIANFFYCLPFVAGGIIHIAHRLFLYKNDLSQKRFISERKFYRFVYFAAGIIFIILKELAVIN
ncbi:MAG TPA: UbiA family prenyltransferase, partial [bacterium]|nr:UbiA family prenyltransferase [bacterium]